MASSKSSKTREGQATSAANACGIADNAAATSDAAHDATEKIADKTKQTKKSRRNMHAESSKPLALKSEAEAVPKWETE